MDVEHKACYNCYEWFPKLRQTQLVGNVVWLCDACVDIADVATVRCDGCNRLKGQLDFAVGQAELHKDKAKRLDATLGELRGQIAALLESYQASYQATSQGKLPLTDSKESQR